MVDATYMRVTVPAMRPPAYAVRTGVACIPPNELPRQRARSDHYTVIGAGKTGMDACLWLLRHGVEPAGISWVMPRDSWLLDRARIQPGPEFAPAIAAGFGGLAQSVAGATSIEDLFDRLNACGQLLRFDESVRPTMYRCATVSLAELEQLRRINDVVRMGRVRELDSTAMVLDGGTVATMPGTLFVDCTADGLERRPSLPVFAEGALTLQSVRTCQQVFSAAFIAHVEGAYADDALKNELCVPVPHPDSDIDWLRSTIANGRNQRRWAEDAAVQAWLRASRLDFLSQVGPQLPPDPAVRAEILRSSRPGGEALEAKLLALLAAEGHELLG